MGGGGGGEGGRGEEGGRGGKGRRREAGWLQKHEEGIYIHNICIYIYHTKLIAYPPPPPPQIISADPPHLSSLVLS